MKPSSRTTQTRDEKRPAEEIQQPPASDRFGLRRMMRHDHQVGASKRSLTSALFVTGTWFAVELAAGFYTNSLALLADAAHMLTDLAALSLSLFALSIATRPATHEKTYGYLRVEILAALANGVFLVLISGYVSYEALHRLVDPPAVKSVPMLLVASLGLLANLGAAGFLYRCRHESLNMRSAYLHILGDALGSIGAIIAGIMMVSWQWYVADPIVSILVAALIAYSAWKLIRESVDVLLEATPAHLNIGSILADLGEVDGVLSVHDLHVWSITSGIYAMSCHAVLCRNEDALQALRAVNSILREKYGIEHTTIQIEVENWSRSEAGTR